ncbi:hypothetical protein BSR29_06525 [Boudabousia liubingyangii]|uniref:DoxX family protein n=1 Tax=Boudabousia liubingyangii TaxID=1921764 RepID=A0A1Q5PKV1_9ACTO|nr:DoxX family membrane protein [Boudabousia liubingyangii]OKL46410.1 hypothetical protein BSR28_07755 [Boudabousia liubingyangii]OKL47268.1 hypothetical protein BSR29_06525 [Boudabousia liubingyangii]
MNILRTMIRPLVAAPFIVEGIDAIKSPKAHARKVEKIAPTLRRFRLDWVADHPQLASRAAGAVTVCAAGALALGKAPRTAATLLTAVSLPIACAQVASEESISEKIQTGINRGALTGALVLAALDRQGAPSLMWRASNFASRTADKAAVQAEQVKAAAHSQLVSAKSAIGVN